MTSNIKPSDGDHDEDVNPSALTPLPKELEEILVRVPEPKQQVLRRHLELSWFEGPLPPPEMLKAYNEVYSGCAQDIVAMAKADQAHMHATVTSIVIAGIRADREGQFIAGGLAAIFLIGSFAMIAIGQVGIGSLGLGGTALSLVGLFIRAERQKDRQAAEIAEQQESAHQPDRRVTPPGPSRNTPSSSKAQSRAGRRANRK